MAFDPKAFLEDRPQADQVKQSSSTPFDPRAFLTGSNVPSEPTVSDQQQAINQFVKSQQSGPFAKIGDLINSAISQPSEALGAGSAGAQEVLKNNPITLQDAITTLINPTVGLINSGAGQQASQSGLEAGGRMIFDLGNQINEAIQRGANNVATNPVGTAISALFPSLNIAKQLIPHTPNQSEIDQFLQDQLNAKQVAAVKSQPLVPEVLGTPNLDLSRGMQAAAEVAPLLESGGALAGRALESGIGKVNSAVNAIKTRGILRQPLTAATTEALGITPIEGSQQIVPVLKSSILEANGGEIPTGIAPKELIQRAADFKINQYVDGLKLAEEQGLRHSTQSLVDAMDQRIARDHPTYDQSQIDSIVQTVKNENKKLFSSDYVSPTEGQRYAVQINRDLNKTNPNRVPKTDAQVSAETGLSQELSRQGSEMYQASTGTYGTPNQDWGVLTQAEEGLTGQLGKAQKADAGKTPGGEQIPTTLSGLVTKGVKRVGGRALIPTNAEDVASGFNRTLSEGPTRPTPGAIDPIQRQAIINQYSAPSELSFEAQLKNIIQKLPKEFRGRNERSLAEAILRSQQAP